MAAKWLLGALMLELLSEVFCSAIALIVPAWSLTLFGVHVLPETLFLTFVLGLTFGFVAAVIALAIYWILTGERRGWHLSYLLGIFWVLFGGALFMVQGRTENIYLDLIPGIVVLALTVWSARERKARTRWVSAEAWHRSSTPPVSGEIIGRARQ